MNRLFGNHDNALVAYDSQSMGAIEMHLEQQRK